MRYNRVEAMSKRKPRPTGHEATIGLVPRPLNIAGLSEAADLLGMSASNLSHRRKSDPRFPAPDVELKQGPVWRVPRLLAYKERHMKGRAK